MANVPAASTLLLNFGASPSNDKRGASHCETLVVVLLADEGWRGNAGVIQDMLKNRGRVSVTERPAFQSVSPCCRLTDQMLA